MLPDPFHSERSGYPSAQSTRTGLTSTTGVPSMASIGPIRNRVPEISRTVTRCSPNGFGRCGDRVVNTPASERHLGVTARVHFEHVAIRAMKPGDDDSLVARGDPE